MYNLSIAEQRFLWFSHIPIFVPCALHILQLCLRWSLVDVLGRKLEQRKLKLLYLAIKGLKESYQLIMSGVRQLVYRVKFCPFHRDKIALQTLWSCFLLTDMQISELVCLELFWDGVDLWIYEGLNCPDIHERVFTALFVVSFPRVHHSEVNLPALLAGFFWV